MAKGLNLRRPRIGLLDAHDHVVAEGQRIAAVVVLADEVEPGSVWLWQPSATARR